MLGAAVVLGMRELVAWRLTVVLAVVALELYRQTMQLLEQLI